MLTSTTPTFRWEKVPGANLYAFYVSRYPYGTKNLVYKNKSLKKTSFKIPNGCLVDGERYRWNVMARKKSKWKDSSEQFYFQVKLKKEKPALVLSEPANKKEPVLPEAEKTKKKNTSPDKLTARDWYRQGNDAFDREEYDTALSYYTKSIKLEPNSFEIYNNRGNTYACKGEYGEAIADFDRALKLNPNFAMPYYNRGFIYAHQNKYDQAIADFDRALKLNVNFPEAYYMRGAVYEAKNEYEKAVSDFDRAILLNPDYAEAYYGRAIAYSSLKEYGKAATDIKKSQVLGFPVNPKMVELLLKGADGKE